MRFSWIPNVVAHAKWWRKVFTRIGLRWPHLEWWLFDLHCWHSLLGWSEVYHDVIPSLPLEASKNQQLKSLMLGLPILPRAGIQHSVVWVRLPQAISTNFVRTCKQKVTTALNRSTVRTVNLANICDMRSRSAATKTSLATSAPLTTKNQNPSPTTIMSNFDDKYLKLDWISSISRMFQKMLLKLPPRFLLVQSSPVYSLSFLQLTFHLSLSLSLFRRYPQDIIWTHKHEHCDQSSHIFLKRLRLPT